MTPNLFIVGAMKCGTTSLYNYLEYHPQVCMSKKKEPHYYHFNDKDLDYKGIRDMEMTKKMIVSDKLKYLELFNCNEETVVVGEASAMYLYYPEVAKKIRKDNADSKIIIMLRNPTYRAYSSYMHLVRDGRENHSFEKALTLEEERIDNNWSPIWHYYNAGLYYQQVKKYYEAFGENKVLTIIFEDFIKNTDEELSRVYSFLDIENIKISIDDTIFNKSGKPIFQWVHNILRYHNKFKNKIGFFIPEKFKNAIRHKLINLNLRSKPKLEESVVKKLNKKYYPDIRKLSDLINQDLISKWGI